MAALQKEPNGLAPAIAVFECPVIHVHADERVRSTALKAACVLHRVVEGTFSVLQAVRNAGSEMARDVACQRGAKVLSDDVTAERERQPGLGEPPFAHVGDEVQPAIGEGELALVDQQSEVDVAVLDGILDRVEWRGDRDEVGLVQPQGEEGTREGAGNGDALAANTGPRHWLPRHESRTVLIAHGRTVREEGVFVGQVRVRMDRDRSYLELTEEGALVERFYILQLVDVTQIAGIDLPFGKSVEHERVVGIRAVGDVDGSSHGCVVVWWE